MVATSAYAAALLMGSAAALFGSSAPTPAAADRAASVEEILRLEDVNRVVFAPDGRDVLYEWVPPYLSAPNTASYLGDLDLSVLSKIYRVDLQRGEPPQPLFPQQQEASYWLGGFAPSGKYLAIFGLEGGKARAGALQLSTRTIKWFDFFPNYSADIRRPLWIHGERLVYAAVVDNDPLSGQGKRGYAQTIGRHWERTFEGQQASVTAIASASTGLTAADHFREGRLMLADAATGRSTRLAEGYFHGLRLSRGGRYLSALREAGAVQPRVGDSIDAYAYGPDPNRHALIVADLVQSKVESPCSECDVLLGSPNWDYGDESLMFLAKHKSEPLSRTRLYQYQPHSSELSEINAHGVRLTCGALFAPGRVHMATLSGEPVVFGYQPITEGPDLGVLDCDSISKVEPRILDRRQARRNDWFLLTADRAVNLTANLPSMAGELVGQSTDAIFLLADGDVWRVSADGRQQNLTTDVGPLLPITGQEIFKSYWRDLDGANGYPVPTEIAMLAASDDVFVIDLRTSGITRVQVPAALKQFRAMDASRRKVIVQQFENAALSALSLLETDKRPRKLVEINREGRIFAAPQATIHFTGPNGSPLQSCLMLPPGWTSRRRYPAIVVTYPDTDGACWSDGHLSPARLGALDTEVLAGSGYVVIHTAEPASEVRNVESRTANLTAVVLKAVDAAVEAGYADPDRIGLIGISQGMLSALQLATETDRFKAVVVGFGVSNAASYYNALFLRCRLGQCPPGAASRYEHPLSPNYIGAKPWEAPHLYIANSPVFRADRVQAPILLFASDFDVSPNQSEEMFAALYRQRKEAALAFYWGEEHGVFSPANMRDYWGRILDWYERHLQTGAKH